MGFHSAFKGLNTFPQHCSARDVYTITQ